MREVECWQTYSASKYSYMHSKLLGAFPFDTSASKMDSISDLKKHKCSAIDALRNAELSISKITKQLSRSRGAIKRYIKDPRKYGNIMEVNETQKCYCKIVVI